MEQIACIVGGIALIACVFGLSRLKPPNWSSGDVVDASQPALQRWPKLQRSVRNINNTILGLVGLMIISTGFLPHSLTKLVVWAGILILLMVCIVLAMIDAFSSFAGYRKALPEAARKSLGEDSKLLANIESED